MNKILQYFSERFPLSQYIPLTTFFGVAAAVAVQTKIFGAPKQWGRIVVAIIALLLFLLRLRIFDEFKDYEHDKEHYPDRPIPRGLVSLGEMKYLLFGVIIVEVLLSTIFGLSSFFLFALIFIYSLVMFKEFFIRKWLRNHFTTYIFLHEIVVIPLFLYLFSIQGMKIEHLTNIYFWKLSLFFGLLFFLLEVARKFRSKEDEIPSQDTYTAQYGIKGASFLLFSLTVLILFLGLNLFATFNQLIVLGVITLELIIIASILKFVIKKRSKDAKLVFNSSIVFVFGILILFVIVLV